MTVRRSAPEPSLSSLFDRLADDSELYAPLEAPPADHPNPADAETTIRAIIDFAEDDDEPPVEPAPRR